MKPTTQWATVSTPDQAHLLPVTPVHPFKTRQQAQRFLDHLTPDQIPITDEDGNVVATLTGHTLSSSCLCGPTPRDSGLLVHNQPN